MATRTWRGGASGDVNNWHNAANWVEGAIPTQSDSVVFNATGVGYDCIASAPVVYGSLSAISTYTQKIDFNGYSVTAYGNSSFDNRGVLALTGGYTQAANGNLTFGSNIRATRSWGGELRWSASGTITANQSMILGSTGYMSPLRIDAGVVCNIAGTQYVYVNKVICNGELHLVKTLSIDAIDSDPIVLGPNCVISADYNANLRLQYKGSSDLAINLPDQMLLSTGWNSDPRMGFYLVAYGPGKMTVNMPDINSNSVYLQTGADNTRLTLNLTGARCRLHVLHFSAGYTGSSIEMNFGNAEVFANRLIHNVADVGTGRSVIHWGQSVWRFRQPPDYSTDIGVEFTLAMNLDSYPENAEIHYEVTGANAGLFLAAQSKPMPVVVLDSAGYPLPISEDANVQRLQVKPGNTVNITSGKRVTIAHFSPGDWDGTAGNPTVIKSATAGQSATVRVPRLAQSASNCILTDINLDPVTRGPVYPHASLGLIVG